MMVVYVVIGFKWQALAARSISGLKRYHPEATVTVIGDPVDGADSVIEIDRRGMNPIETSRWAKVNLPGLLYGAAPRGAETLYLDADTEVAGRLDGWLTPLAAGADLVITPSSAQGRRIMQQLMQPERAATLDEVGDAVQWQCGAFAWRDNGATRALWAAWAREWGRWRLADQGAFIRAIAGAPVRMWVLGRAWNGGEVLVHRSAGDERTSPPAPLSARRGGTR